MNFEKVQLKINLVSLAPEIEDTFVGAAAVAEVPGDHAHHDEQ